MRLLFARLILPLLLAAALLTPEQSAAAPSLQPAAVLTLEIRHLWQGQIVSVPATGLPTASGDHLELTRLAYLLSNPLAAKVDPHGSIAWLQRDQWQACVDATDGLARITMSGLPRAKYAALQFQIGLDEKTNASDPNSYPAGHPLNPANNLHWSWQGGYIFLAAEGHFHPKENVEPIGFSYHLGNAHNLMTVALPLKLDLTERDATVIIDFHLDRVFAGKNPIDIAARTSTHGREGDDHAAALLANIEEAFSVRQLRYPAPTPRTETKDNPSAPTLIGTPYPFTLPDYFPRPALPTDYPLTHERVALGKKLFHDPLLSRNGSISCASCHQTPHALTDGRQFSVGIDGQTGTRNAMPLSNLAWKTSFFWDGRAPSLREQALIPIEDPVEMHDSLDHVVDKLAAHDEYPALFQAAFGNNQITADKLGIAIEQFVLTLTSFDSRFDRSMRGDGETLTDQEKRGFELFFTEYDPRQRLYGADCFHCHGGAFFTDHRFHNNGLTPTGDLGLEHVTGLESDRAKFSTPSLRNIALTAPYMHDGRFTTLEEVLDHYTGGIETSPTLDPNLAKHPNGGVPLSDEDRAAIIAFLKTLSDPQFLANTE